jgi:hypothetical protein
MVFLAVGLRVGDTGAIVGLDVGVPVEGTEDTGLPDGTLVGSEVGVPEGLEDGIVVGSEVGKLVGDLDLVGP